MNDTQSKDQEITPSEITVMPPGVMAIQAKAEIDSQIATAHQFPRSYESFLKRAESLATCRPEIAAAMEYAKPVAGKMVKGPSSRAAEIISATYGNLRVQARVLTIGDREVIAQGICHDLETNVAHSVEVHESIIKKDGTRYNESQLANVCGSACSKARRNAVFLTVPLALCAPILEAAKAVAAGSAATLPDRREKALKWFEEKGCKRSAILRWLGVKGEADIDLEKMADLNAARTSAKEEGISLVELFGAGLEKRDSNGLPATKQTELTEDQRSELGGIMASILAESDDATLKKAQRELDKYKYDPASEILDQAARMLREVRGNG